MRASEMRNWPISKPNSAALSQSRMSSGKTPLQHQERQGKYTERQRQREFGQPGELLTARRIEPEAPLQHDADRVRRLARLAREGADGEEEQCRGKPTTPVISSCCAAKRPSAT